MRRNTRIGALLALLVGAAAPEPVTAQTQPVLRLTEPQEWRAGGSLIVAPNSTVRVRGVASHPGGVLRVLVDGQESTLRPDPEFPELVNFERAITPTRDGPVVVRIVPRSGEPYELSFGLELTAAPRPPSVATEPPQQAARPRAETPRRSNPWKPFRLRGIVYAAAAAGGAVLAMQEKTSSSESCRQVTGGFDCVVRTEVSSPNQALGFGLAGAAAGALVLDALLTSRKARSAPIGGGDHGEPAAELRLQRPGFGLSGDRLRFDWVRLRF